MEHERSIMLFCFVNSARPDFMPIHTAHQHMADDVLMRENILSGSQNHVNGTGSLFDELIK